MSASEAQTAYEQLRDFLIDKRSLTLEVTVKNQAEIEQILSWMYSPKERQPMAAELVSVSWKDPVFEEATETMRALMEAGLQKEADLIGKLLDALRTEAMRRRGDV